MFKHAIEVNASSNTVKEFQKEIVNLGYKEGARITGNDYGNGTYLRTYTDMTIYDLSDKSHSHANPSKFQIEEKWQYEAALAIASIREGDKFHVGEWIIVTENSGHNSMHSWYNNGTRNSIYKGLISKIEEIDNTVNAHSFGSTTIRINNTAYRSPYVKKLNPEEIIKFFKQKYTNMSDTSQREIIGYRIIKDGPGFKKGTELKARTDIKGGARGWKEYEIDKINAYTVKFPDDVLVDTEWFEPIYKELTKYETLYLGSRDTKIIVSSKGSIATDRGTSPINISNLKNLRNILTSVNDIELGNFAPYPDKSLRFIRIGCEAENNLFSITEIDSVINLYNKLNP